MIRNYLNIAFRILWNNKVFSLINIFGLAIGMAAALILFHYVRFERSYDAFHKNADHIYRVNYAFESPGWTGTLPTTHPGVGPMLKEEITDIMGYTRFFNHSYLRNTCILSYHLNNGKNLIFDEDQQKVFWADASVFTMFSFPLTKGNPESALEKPNTIALSESTARKYFGDQDPVGQILHLEDWSKQENKNYMVTAVFKDVPVNSHLQFDILISFATLNANRRPGLESFDTWWHWPQFSNYIMLNEKSKIEDVSLIAVPLFEKYNKEENEKFNTTMGAGEGFKFPFQPLNEIYLNNISSSDFTQKSEIEKLYFLSLVAILILIIGCINYINLSTAKATQRSKEVSLRKVIGASRKHILIQFLFESTLLNILALVLAITIIQMVAQTFNNFIQKEVLTNELVDNYFIGTILVLFISCIVISGLYPAFMLSSFKIVESIKGKLYHSSKGFFLRNSLVLFQFVVSVILISGIYAIWQQLYHMDQQDLGFNKQKIISINFPTQRENLVRLESFKQELHKEHSIASISNSQCIPGIKNFGNFFLRYDAYENNSNLETAGKGCRFFSVDADYLETFDIQMIAGRNFAQEDKMDHDAVLLNDRARKDLGYDSPEAALGTYIVDPSGMPKLKVIGVFEDYYHEAPKWDVFPMILQNKGYAGEFRQYKARDPWPGKYLSLKFNSQDIPGTIQLVRSEWENYFPEVAFDYFFLDENYNIQYGDDQQLARIVGVFSIVAVIITCMGLFGLTLYTTIKRTKEIGIRKVLGAPGRNIMTLLTKDSFRLILLASIIAIPISYLGINQWLENFASRIKISPGLFFIPILIVFLIAATTIFWQIIKAMRSNPVKALRNE